jgi:hypothetical protein
MTSPIFSFAAMRAATNSLVFSDVEKFKMADSDIFAPAIRLKRVAIATVENHYK